MANSKSNFEETVIAYIKKVDNPLLELIEAIRNSILNQKRINVFNHHKRVYFISTSSIIS